MQVTFLSYIRALQNCIFYFHLLELSLIENPENVLIYQVRGISRI